MDKFVASHLCNLPSSYIDAIMYISLPFTNVNGGVFFRSVTELIYNFNEGMLGELNFGDNVHAEYYFCLMLQLYAQQFADERKT